MIPITAGRRLKQMRQDLGLTIREVEELSLRISNQGGNDQLYLSHARITQIENDHSVPGVFKLLTLSAAYGRPIMELLSLYVDLDGINRMHATAPHQATRPLHPDLHTFEDRLVEMPLAFHDAATPERTGFLPELVKVWGHIPFGLLKHLNVRNGRYGIIGLTDYTMYPLLRPGSIVQIDDQERACSPKRYLTELERPLYFIHLRSGYLCCWCEIRNNNRLVAIPHPLSPCPVQEFRYPEDVEIIGRVVAVAARLTEARTVRHAGADVENWFQNKEEEQTPTPAAHTNVRSGVR